MKQLKPNFFIIGAPKCGTTSLSVYLSEHQEIVMSNPKEPHYFSTDIENGRMTDQSKYLGQNMLDILTDPSSGHFQYLY
jgi:hypothetical protein